MKLSKIFGKVPTSSSSRPSAPILAVFCVIATALLIPTNSGHGTQRSSRFGFLDAPAAVYSTDANDSWNRIFYFLFSRRVETRLTDEFPEAGPFTFNRADDARDVMLSSPIGISTRSFARDEIGDRAIDPLYPSFFRSAGVEAVLADPAYSGLSKALVQALGENTARSPVARALLQADLWSAYDILYAREFKNPGREQIEQRRRALMDLLGRLIRKIALSGPEIDSLPANYSIASAKQSLPDVFRKDSGWIEVEWFPHRLHVSEASYRRVARVFLKPAAVQRDLPKFLNGLPLDERLFADLDGAALLIQLLLIDENGRLAPTRLATDVQIRLFKRTGEGAFKTTDMQAFEINRRNLLGGGASGGLVREDENGPAYLAASGNDFTFASPQLNGGSPVQAKLRTRCTACHGNDLARVMTFSFMVPPGTQVPTVKQLDSDGHQFADAVMEAKAKRMDFESLRMYFTAAR